MMINRAALVPIVCGVLGATVLSLIASPLALSSDALSAIQSISNSVHALVVRGYDLAPALTLGLLIIAALPIIAILSPLVIEASRPDLTTRRVRGGQSNTANAEFFGPTADRAAYTYLEVVGAERNRYAIVRDMLRIGREDDNDIRIPSDVVHRYHAAIYREYTDEWRLADLSGSGGNGVRINGKCCRDALLHDGDIIELGPGRLRFRAI